MALPLAKNNPVPMAPPMAIMDSWRSPMPRLSSRVSMRSCGVAIMCLPA
jgi:hypothetical protein